VQAFLLARLPREAAAIAAAVAALDSAAMAQGAAITRPFARAVLAGLFGDDDGSVASPPGCSPDPGAVG